eukprot:CAMPEP_0172450102 /NCGR_PEP_ID=MMETSP1065-20121228/8597_1 /TAXON_ID=265537 /ORGANISM="Amphiprora paludosa, Strain CCMP125" /LENGTH=96 /DNA_ID=CAMNT_0013201875 /DNA_START=30 /DNA_END=320 /DNA_ORIENTATION=+
MGNDASTMVAMAGAKAKMNATLGDINKSLDGQPKQEDAGYAGVATKKESDQRRKDREREYELKKKERAARKSKLSEQWASHRQANEEKPEKKSSLW